MTSFHKKIIFGTIILVIAVALIYYFGLSRYLSLESIKSNAAYLLQKTKEHYFTSVCIFIAISIALIAFTLPVTAPVAVVAGFLFGLLPAILYTMVSVMMGTAISFLVIRYAMKRVTDHHQGKQLSKFKHQLHKYGHSYLITLQLLTVVPYFIINTLAALGGVPFHIFMMTTFIGSLPVVGIYAFAGRQLYHIKSWQDILSWNMLLLLLMLAFLAMVPMIVKRFRKV